MIPEIGQRLGPYEILGELAGSGMAQVLRGWDRRLQREVAIKVIRHGAEQAEVRERLVREARAASGLLHPNICTIFDLGEQDGALFLVMELLQGRTLKERIAEGAMPWQEVVRHGREMAGALAVAHRRGIVHRDIKPANIFLVNQPDGGCQAKLLDFGLAKQRQEGQPPGPLTGPEHAVGTVAYMSPEQARGEALDGRSDLFSLGVVLYEMVRGKALFSGGTGTVVFAQLLGEGRPELARSLEVGTRKGLERIIRRLLEREPERRFQSAEELEDELTALDPERKQRWFRRRPAEVAAREPATRPKYPPRKVEAPRIQAVWEQEHEAFRVPARAETAWVPERGGELARGAAEGLTGGGAAVLQTELAPELSSEVEVRPAAAVWSESEGGLERRKSLHAGVGAGRAGITAREWPELRAEFFEDWEEEVETEEAIAGGELWHQHWGWAVAVLLVVMLVGVLLARERGWLGGVAPQRQGRVLRLTPLGGERLERGLREADV